MKFRKDGSQIKQQQTKKVWIDYNLENTILITQCIMSWRNLPWHVASVDQLCQKYSQQIEDWQEWMGKGVSMDPSDSATTKLIKAWLENFGLSLKAGHGFFKYKC